MSTPMLEVTAEVRAKNPDLKPLRFAITPAVLSAAGEVVSALVALILDKKNTRQRLTETIFGTRALDREWVVIFAKTPDDMPVLCIASWAEWLLADGKIP